MVCIMKTAWFSLVWLFIVLCVVFMTSSFVIFLANEIGNISSNENMRKQSIFRTKESDTNKKGVGICYETTFQRHSSSRHRPSLLLTIRRCDMFLLCVVAVMSIYSRTITHYQSGKKGSCTRKTWHNKRAHIRHWIAVVWCVPNTAEKSMYMNAFDCTRRVQRNVWIGTAHNPLLPVFWCVSMLLI